MLVTFIFYQKLSLLPSSSGLWYLLFINAVYTWRRGRQDLHLLTWHEAAGLANSHESGEQHSQRACATSLPTIGTIVPLVQWCTQQCVFSQKSNKVNTATLIKLWLTNAYRAWAHLVQNKLRPVSAREVIVWRWVPQACNKHYRINRVKVQRDVPVGQWRVLLEHLGGKSWKLLQVSSCVFITETENPSCCHNSSDHSKHNHLFWRHTSQPFPWVIAFHLGIGWGGTLTWLWENLISCLYLIPHLSVRQPKL